MKKKWKIFRNDNRDTVMNKGFASDCFYTDKTGVKQVSFWPISFLTIQFWKENLKSDYPELFKLFDQICQFIQANAENERHFSLLNKVKTYFVSFSLTWTVVFVFFDRIKP